MLKKFNEACKQFLNESSDKVYVIRTRSKRGYPLSKSTIE